MFEGLDRVDLALALRAAVAAALGFVIGWERERQGSAAGDRTYALVALGAAAFTAVAIDRFQAAAPQLLGGIVTGVGFLGAGMIMHDGATVRGLTSAAAMWATAAVGMVVGSGDLIIGITLTGFVLLILVWERVPGLSRVGHRKPGPGATPNPASSAGSEDG
ncbi:MAG: MgtC family protein [Anaerolinea sp.]|nr:MgtC family protein [Anaerolinea sp.]